MQIQKNGTRVTAHEQSYGRPNREVGDGFRGPQGLQVPTQTVATGPSQAFRQARAMAGYRMN